MRAVDPRNKSGLRTIIFERMEAQAGQFQSVTFLSG